MLVCFNSVSILDILILWTDLATTAKKQKTASVRQTKDNSNEFLRKFLKNDKNSTLNWQFAAVRII